MHSHHSSFWLTSVICNDDDDDVLFIQTTSDRVVSEIVGRLIRGIKPRALSNLTLWLAITKGNVYDWNCAVEESVQKQKNEIDNVFLFCLKMLRANGCAIVVNT